ncbi:MAG: hypothetical protein GY705_14345 [Bacteroidetes bacterium]|nr:hypothetical protein [Bacteroidota bacterium]
MNHLSKKKRPFFISKKEWALFCFFILPIIFLFAQEPAFSAKIDKVKKAENAIETLKNGKLIVQLPSDHRKITSMQKLVDSPKVDEKEKKRLKQLLETTVQENKEHNRLLIQAFREYYDFSEIYFIHDTASMHLKKGVMTGIFLDDNLKENASISPELSDYLILRRGLTDYATSARKEALIFMDAHHEYPPKPFPNYFGLNSFQYIFDKIFQSSEAEKRNYPRVINKLNQKLHKYYSEVN